MASTNNITMSAQRRPLPALRMPVRHQINIQVGSISSHTVNSSVQTHSAKCDHFEREFIDDVYDILDETQLVQIIPCLSEEKFIQLMNSSS